ncbi:MAG: 1-acyl-sn-glycerol-3-phosphate acyltransferase [Bacteroidetes bacterium]|nr:MAG: 1-acyl-sn-glycerol-3-phosphate acyltransferase [Bacteroidota bacterium]
MNLLKRSLLLIYFIYALVLFVAWMLFFFPFIVLVSFLGPVRGGNLIYKICMIWGEIWFPLVGIFHKNIFEFPHDKNHPYIFVANHLSFLDAAILVKTFRQPVRPLGKEEISKIPVFGFIYRNAIVTVHRSDARDRAKSVRRLKRFVEKGISILIFPEGTFNETGKPVKGFFDGAFRIAIETQTPIKPVLFLDAYDRMHFEHILTLNPGRSRAIYLEPVPVEGLTMKDLPALREKVYSIMDKKLREYNASWIK